MYLFQTLYFAVAWLLLLVATASLTETARRDDTASYGSNFWPNPSRSDAENQARYTILRQQGYDEVGHTVTAAALRKYSLYKYIPKNQSSNEFLFPGEQPQPYSPHTSTISIRSSLVKSKKSAFMVDISTLPQFVNATDFSTSPTPNNNIGAQLLGYGQADKDMGSLLPIKVLQNTSCTPFATVFLNPKKARFVKGLIHHQFRIHFSLDGLPVLLRSRGLNYAIRGIPVGFIAPGRRPYHPVTCLYTHYRFQIVYEKKKGTDAVYITGFDAHPVSMDHHSEQACRDSKASPENNHPNHFVSLDPGDPTNLRDHPSLVFSYDVQWIEGPLSWDDRWDIYLLPIKHMQDRRWWSLCGSSAVVLLLVGVVYSLMRSIHKDISGGSSKKESSDGNKWQDLTAKVFLPPKYPMLLSVGVGSGMQLLAAVMLTLIFSIGFRGVVHSTATGELLTVFMATYAANGLVGGLVAGRVLSSCTDLAAMKSRMEYPLAFGIPGTIYIFHGMKSLVAYSAGASCTNLETMGRVLLLWIISALPLTYLGLWLGRKPSNIARTTPKECFTPQMTKLSQRMLVHHLGGGFFLAFTLYTEFRNILSSVWLDTPFVSTNLCLLTVLLVVVKSMIVSIILCYMQLSQGDAQWWSRSSLWHGLSVSIATFCICLQFLWTRLDFSEGSGSEMVYLCDTLLVSMGIGLVCGSIGFLACLWFTKSIYGALKRQRITLPNESDEEGNSDRSLLSEPLPSG